MYFFFKRAYRDPFIPENDIMHIEIVELLKVTNYTKRRRNIPNVEIISNTHSFDIKDGTLERCNLSIFEYLELLKNKDSNTKKQFNYDLKENPMVTVFYSQLDRLNEVGSYPKFSMEIANALGISWTDELRIIIRQMMKINEDLEDSIYDNGDISSVIVNPYVKQKMN
nr:hypothetical protein [Clostridium chromiireducens]